MNDTDLVRKSKRLSWLLRFGAADEGLSVDPAGWVRLDEVLAKAGIRRVDLEAVVAHNNKRRFELDGARIRASQGHGGTMPVTREALEASWALVTQESPVWHGTRLEALESIAASGILASERTHVHLTSSVDSQVGKRAGVAVLLEVSPARLRARELEVYVSPNGVILVRHVPPDCIVGLRSVTRRARKQEAESRALFGLEPLTSG